MCGGKTSRSLSGRNRLRLQSTSGPRNKRFCVSSSELLDSAHWQDVGFLLESLDWALAFPDDYARDRMYAWISHHLDRCQAWGEMAASDGSRALSEHLLQLKFANELMDLG